MLLNIDGVVVFVFVSIIIPCMSWGRRNEQRARTRNVEICKFSQERIKALLFVVPVDLDVGCESTPSYWMEGENKLT